MSDIMGHGIRDIDLQSLSNPRENNISWRQECIIEILIKRRIPR